MPFRHSRFPTRRVSLSSRQCESIPRLCLFPVLPLFHIFRYISGTNCGVAVTAGSVIYPSTHGRFGRDRSRNWPPHHSARPTVHETRRSSRDPREGLAYSPRTTHGWTLSGHHTEGDHIEPCYRPAIRLGELGSSSGRTASGDENPDLNSLTPFLPCFTSTISTMRQPICNHHNNDRPRKRAGGGRR